MKHIIDRIEMYNRLWRGEQLHTISKEYNMTASNLKEVCSYLKIPIPTDVTRFNIIKKKPYNRRWLDGYRDIPNELEIEVIKEGLKTTVNFLGKKIKGEVLIFLSSEERSELTNQIQLMIDNFKENQVLDEKLTNFKSKISKSYKNSKFPYQYQSVHNLRNDYFRDFEGPLNIQVFSDTSVDRIFRIFNMIFNVVKQLGGSLNNDYNFVIGSEVVHFEFYEMQTLEKHQITKEEQKQLNDYQKRKTYWEPSIRKEDYIFNGRLVFNVKESSSWEAKSIKFRDSKEKSLENQIFEIIIALYEMSEIERKKRIAYEIKTEKERIDREQRDRFVERYNLELLKTQELILKANDFYQAQIVREYIHHVDGLIDECDDWCTWANNKADWLDPTCDSNDELFGKKELGLDPLKMKEM